MINIKEFENDKQIVDWLRAGGLSFDETMRIVSYATQCDLSIAVAYVNLNQPIKPNEEKENH